MAMLRPFLLAVFSGLVAVLLQSSPEQLRSRLPGAKRRPDISFRSFSNVLAGVCDDKVCREKLERDAVALGADEVMWMDHAGRGKESTTLEYLARSIFEFHCGDIPDCGGEWWVQFRPTAPKHLPDASKDLPFHWDKDEVENAQANYKGPYLTCVTYLNDATFPTVALDVRLSSVFELAPNVTGGTISRGFVGAGGFGAHVSFDGSLWHGAMMHEALRLGKDVPDFRYVLVMSFWVDGYRPLEASATVPMKSLRNMLKHPLRAFTQPPKSNLQVWGMEEQEIMRAEGSLFDLTFRVEHVNSLGATMHELDVIMCLPTAEYLASNGVSVQIDYGQSCRADVVYKRLKIAGGEWAKGEGPVTEFSLPRFLRKIRLYIQLYLGGIELPTVDSAKNALEDLIQSFAKRTR